jgi:hypothetical protein
MEVLRLRTLWGIDPGKHMENWDKFFPELAQHGYGMCAGETATNYRNVG